MYRAKAKGERRVAMGGQDRTATLVCRTYDGLPVSFHRRRLLRSSAHSRTLHSTISDNEHLALGDMAEASLLLKYNRKRPFDSVAE